MFGMFRLQRLSKHPDNTGKQWIRISFTDILIHHLPACGVLVLLVGDTPSLSKMRGLFFANAPCGVAFHTGRACVYSLRSLLPHSAQQIQS